MIATHVLLGVFLACLAGFVNGTYASPIKYLTKWQNENIWLVFSIFGFLAVPWFILGVFFEDSILSFFNELPNHIIMIQLVGGFIFGIGMIMFTFSLRYLGLGTSFLLNISAGTVAGTLIPIVIIDPSKLFAAFGLLEVIAMALFLCGIIFSSLASHAKHRENIDPTQAKQRAIGITLGAFSGLLTSVQSFAYAYTLPYTQEVAASLGQPTFFAINVPWVAIFSAAFVPYFLYFLKRSYAMNFQRYMLKRESLHYYLIIVVMGIFYFSSLIIFSRSALVFGDLGTVVAWPLLMIFIILTANFWGLVQGEWKNANSKAKRFGIYSIATLIIAVLFIAAAGYLNIQGS